MSESAATYLRATAAAIRANADGDVARAAAAKASAEAQAAGLERAADEVERAGISDIVSVAVFARSIGMTPRAARSALRTLGVELLGPRGARCVRRADLDVWLRASGSSLMTTSSTQKTTPVALQEVLVDDATARSRDRVVARLRRAG